MKKNPENKLTQKELEQIRYRAIRNTYYDVALAKKARKWSNERIEYQLGIKVPKKLPALRKLPSEKTIKAKKRELQRYQYAVLSGLETDRARKLKRYKKERILTTVEWQEAIKLPVQVKDTPESRIERRYLWAKWSKGVLPPEIHAEAKKINRNTITRARPQGYDDTDSYGYAIVYYSFLEQISIEEVLEWWKPDQFDYNKYYDNRKITVS